LFSSSRNNGVEIWDCVRALPDGAGPTRTLSNPVLQNPGLGSVAVDAARAQLFVSLPNGVVVFDNATAVDGGAAPSRTLSGSFGTGIAVDSAGKRLYVNTTSANTAIFNNSDSVSGSAAPVGQISNIGGTTQLWLDRPNNRLYFAANLDFFVINNISNVSGNVAASSGTHWTISNDSSSVILGVSVDGTNAYVAIHNGSTVFMTPNIDTAAAGPLVAPQALILPTGTLGLPLSVVGNVMFIAPDLDPMNRVLIYSDAVNAGSTRPPDKTLVSKLGRLNHALYVP
jgi:hypothetical protein